MGYFPFFTDVKDKKCLIAGGGRVAFRKIEKLMPYGPDITVISKEVSEEIQALSGKISIIVRKAVPEDACGYDVVINATGDRLLAEKMKEICKGKNIPYNSVDDRDNCTFFFPALIRKNGVSIGISTEGKSPLYAAFLKDHINDLLEMYDPDTAEEMFRWRKYIKKNVDSEAKRKVILAGILKMITDGKEADKETVDRMIKES